MDTLENARREYFVELRNWFAIYDTYREFGYLPLTDFPELERAYQEVRKAREKWRNID